MEIFRAKGRMGGKRKVGYWARNMRKQTYGVRVASMTRCSISVKKTAQSAFSQMDIAS